MPKDLIIRSSSAEFLIFERQTHDKEIQVRFEEGDLWLTQKAMSELYDCSTDNISLHLKNIYNDLELDKGSTTEDFSIVQKEGNIKRNIKYYNLDAVRRFYQKITDIYATSVDYDSKSPTTIKFFKKVQNKMHYAISHQTAAEIIYNRADSEKEYMGLTSWKNSPNGKILETDVVIAKNYLSKEELEQLELIVSAFLDLAEARAKRNIPMTMEDWSTRIDRYLLSDDRDILKDAGKISHEIACDKALTEFEKYRVKQDKLYKSDFDLLIEETEYKDNNKKD